MSVVLTPQLLASTYTYLKSLPPFSRWKLPDEDAVQFHVTRFRHYADCGPDHKGEQVIRVSSARVHHVRTLVLAVAHEMVHLHIILKKVREGEHGRTFRRLAKLASKTLDCDPGEF